MTRTYFNVCPAADGSWNVGVGRQSPINFPHQVDALGAAVQAARTQAENYGICTVVRTRLAKGSWREERSFGGPVRPATPG